MGSTPTTTAPITTTDIPVEGSGDGRTARRTRTRARILAAAAHLMADRGVTGTSIDDVAAQAGVAKGSVFYNFGSKDALCRAVVGGGVDQLTEAIAGARVGREGWEALDSAALALLVSVDDAPDMGQVLATELFRRGRPWQDDLGELRSRLIDPLAEILGEVHRARRAAGLSSAEPDVDHFATVAVSFLGALMFAALDRRAFAPERRLDDVHAALLLTVSGLQA
ncbi:TetR/AcrR family transcriptional regulator [Mariniluteicoccus flavus]